MSAGVPRVVLVDDHGLFRSGVRGELGRSVDVVGEADDVEPAIELISRVLPDVVLLDVHLPGGGGQDVVSAIRSSHPSVKFLALSASDAPEDVIAVIRSGARGYVTKTISTAELTDAIRRVAGLCLTRSPRGRPPTPRRSPRSIPNSTSSRAESAKSCG
jgi:DNA-binding NarL/FixJ family response regulator